MIRKIKHTDNLLFWEFCEKNIQIEYSKLLFRELIEDKKVNYISENNKEINGLLFISKEDKNYLTLIVKNKNIAENLLRVLTWNYNKPLYVKINNNDKIGFTLKKYGFRIIDKVNNQFILFKDKGVYNGKYNNSKHHNDNS